MNFENYDAEMLRLLGENEGKRLLLHSCCAPCSSACLERLTPHFKTAVLYYNPNLDCREEYEKRKEEQLRFLAETGLADFMDCDYSPEDFGSAVTGLEEEREGGARCAVCFRLRLSFTAKKARENGFDFFATTLTLSPLKNAERINRIGAELEREYGVKYLPSDFKKRNGYLRSIELSKQYHLYRQNYCGCRFSKRERQEGKE